MEYGGASSSNGAGGEDGGNNSNVPNDLVPLLPTDEELMKFVLYKTCGVTPEQTAGRVFDLEDIYVYVPENIPSIPQNVIHGAKEEYFFVYMQPNLGSIYDAMHPTACGLGYWKVNGGHIPIVVDNEIMGFKQQYAYYHGLFPGGVKTDWRVIEYRLNTGLVKYYNLVLEMGQNYIICRAYRYKAQYEEALLS